MRLQTKWLRAHFVLALFIASTFFLESAAAQSASDTVTLRGRITNGTAGGQVPMGLEVTLVGLTQSGEETGRSTTIASADSFSAEAPAAERHIALATYLGVTYSSMIEDPAQLADLKIYETTDDDSVIQISSDTTTVIEGDRGIFEVLALIRVKNLSDRTFVGKSTEDGEPAVLRYPVPQGAFDVNPGAGITKGVRPIPQGFTSSDPILPGEVSAGYLYRIRSARSGWTMRRAIFYPTKRLTVLVDEALRLRGPDLRFTKRVRLGEGEERKNYLQYDGREFESGQNLEAEFTPPPEESSNAPLYAGLVIAGILVAGLAVVLPLRKARVRRESSRPALSEREGLIESIAALDEAFESQTLEEEEYLSRRAQMKARLEAMTRDMSTR